MAGADFLIGRGSRGALSRELVVPVPYPPALAERMRQLHTQLVHILGRAIASYRRGAHERCVLHLRHFDRQLRAYLCSEAAELEAYMGGRLALEPDRQLTLRQARTRLRCL